MLFGSDNWAGAAPEIIDAIVKANDGRVPAYGGDALSKAVEKRFCEVFERDVAVFLVATGGAANGLALSAVCPSYGMILCHEASHIQTNECGGPEFYTGGAKLLPLKGYAAKLAPETVEAALAGYPGDHPHEPLPKVLSLTQATEGGAVYSQEELAVLTSLAHERGMLIHIDGARFANAVASVGRSPAELSWQAGVDVLSFGGTKNGCLAAEAVIFFDKAHARDFMFRRKRAGHLWSKQRFIAAQFDAYLKDGFWLKLASKANALARRLSEGLAAIEGVKVWYPTEANEVFVSFPEGVAEKLSAEGAIFYSWITPGDPAGGQMQRLICSFATPADEVERFIGLVQRTVSR
jgi:threonine aldolase